MNIINEHEQSNGNNIIIESSAANNDINHYAFNPNGLRSYYNINNNNKKFIYIVFNITTSEYDSRKFQSSNLTVS